MAGDYFFLTHPVDWYYVFDCCSRNWL